MKILIYTESFFPDMGGLERNTYTLATTLAKLGHETTVLTKTLKSDGIIYPFEVVRSHQYKAFFNAIKQTDLVFINGGISLKICGISLLLHKKYAIIYANSNLYIRENDRLGTKMRQFLAEKAALNIALSDYAKNRLKALLRNQKVEKLLNPIDGKLEQIAANKLQNKPNKIYDILFAGRIIEGKGIFILIDALAAIKPIFKNLKIAFAGEGEHTAKLIEYAKEKDISIAYLGRLDNDDLIDTYLQSKVLIVPSSTHTEGNPLVIAEAISLGVPVIASNQDAMIEAVGEAGYIFKSGESDDLAEKISLLFNELNLLEKTNNTTVRKQEFSYAQYTFCLNNIVTDLSSFQKLANLEILT
jgi:glycosyltransferase involved in cell wall biosynthesis